MLDMIQQDLEDIKDSGSTRNDYLRHLFHALITYTNVIFRDFIQVEKDKWETEGTTTFNKLSNLDRNKFNNMVATTEWYKSDPKNAVIAFLTNRVHNLEDVRSHGNGRNLTKTTTIRPYGQGSSKYVPGCPGPSKR